LIWALRDIQKIPKYAGSGTSQAILSNRISWWLNLHGTSLTLDTACSSGLVALDLACQGLWNGRNDVAIVGASSLILSPEFNVMLSNMNFLSRDGKCFSFDHRANGYARGEGFTTLIVKPLSKALRDGNNIRALIRAVGSNQDGKTTGGITVPSRKAQRQLIQDTYRKANLDMRETRYFEAHGTGTPVGDPAEAHAIGTCFGKFRSNEDPLYVGE
jgi:acyl transferase domain-containing protein